MEYLKKFSTHSDYETFTGSTDFICPNVSYCENEDEVHFNHQHEYVDLGLPSGTLWATENIKDANGNNLYFAWGETQGYTEEQVVSEEEAEAAGGYKEGEKAFSWDDYEFGFYTEPEKYNEDDGLTVLEPENDAATVNWGGGWRMPTNEEFEELTANTEYEVATVNGITGTKLTSTVEGYTDKFLFFPAVGLAENGIVYDVGSRSSHWSASLLGVSLNYGSSAYLFDTSIDITTMPRCYGYSVRPVRV